VVGVTEDGAENSEGSCVVEDRAEGNGGGLDGWEVWRRISTRFPERPIQSQLIEDVAINT
jgi:hypothetical protein